jgi:hypothetical protein
VIRAEYSIALKAKIFTISFPCNHALNFSPVLVSKVETARLVLTPSGYAQHTSPTGMNDLSLTCNGAVFLSPGKSYKKQH